MQHGKVMKLLAGSVDLILSTGSVPSLPDLQDCALRVVMGSIYGEIQGR